MRIVELFGHDKLPVSFEVFPPKGELPIEQARAVIAQIAPLSPSFVSVTCSAGGSGNSGNTVAVAQMAAGEFGLTAMAHLTCMGATASGIDESLAAAKAAGLDNVLALRGDLAPGREPIDFQYAADLIPRVRDAGFCVGAAAYPEGHISCLDPEADLRRLRRKQDAGAEFFVTQLFFDNEVGLRFLDKARDAGVTAPITMGIMPFMSKDQLSRMVFMCGASLPSPIIKLLARWEHDPESLRQAGVDYACKQLVGLAEAGVDGLHVYTMNKPEVARAAAVTLAAYR